MTSLDTPCREWNGYRGKAPKKNYGVIQRTGKSVRVHRWVWELANGPIPEGMCVCHRCDNPPCFRLDHLFLGTHAENMADMAAKKRLIGKNEYQASKTHCPQGHAYAGDNLIVRRKRNGTINRICRICLREANRRYHARKKIAEPVPTTAMNLDVHEVAGAGKRIVDPSRAA